MQGKKKLVVDGKLDCSKCGEWKVLDEFESCSRTTTGKQPRCRACNGRVQPAGVRGRRPILPVDGQFQCIGCDEWKPLEQFEKSKASAFGRTRRCTQCGIARNELFDSRSPRNFLARMARNLRRVAGQRTKRSDPSFSKEMLDPDLLMELFEAHGGRCAVTGTPMTHVVSSQRTWSNISIDRIDSAKGYERGNVQLVCAAINQMKNEMPEDEFRRWAERIINPLK